MADPDLFFQKYKLVTYARVFVEYYNQKNHKQVLEKHEIIELKKINTLIIQNSCNFGAYLSIEIFMVFCITHIIFRNKNKVMFYVNNFINQNQFNKLYYFD